MALDTSIIGRGIRNREVTPLVIVLAFILLTEVVVMIGVLGTREHVQVILATFCVLFPVALAGSFFWILYRKAYVFYGPSAYPPNVDPERYIAAIRAQASISNEWQKIVSQLPDRVARAVSSGSAASLYREAIRGEGGLGIDPILNLGQEIGASLAKDIERNEIVNVDITDFGGDILQIPAFDGITVADLLDAIWFELNALADLPGFQYPTAWVLKDTKSGQRLNNMGSRWARGRDIRSLDEVGIRPGASLRAIDLRRNTKRKNIGGRQEQGVLPENSVTRGRIRTLS